MNQERLQQKRQLIEGKIVIGIDPAKCKHQAAIVQPDGMQLGKSFSFPVNTDGFQTLLWKNVAKVLPNCNPQNTIFALETSCNLWQTLAFYLHSVCNFTVVLASEHSLRASDLEPGLLPN